MAAKLRTSQQHRSTKTRYFSPLAAEQLEVRAMLAGDTPVTEAPALVKDINPGVAGTSLSSLTRSGGYVYFAAETSYQESELWRTDGTEQNTTLVKDFAPLNLVLTDQIVDVNGVLFFTLKNSSTSKYELWTSDGTEGGTSLVAQFNFASGGFGSPPTGVPSNLTSAGGQLYFYMNDGVHGKELWTSNGTAGGTFMVKDANGLSSSSLPSSNTLISPVGVGDTVYFVADNGSFGHYQLWKTDGTEQGTVQVQNYGAGVFDPYLLSYELLAVGDTLYMEASYSGQTTRLWKSDGTDSGTVQVSDASVYRAFPGMVEFHGEVYFIGATPQTNDWELWKSDGTAAGAVQVTDVAVGPDGSNPDSLVVAGDTLFFVADDGIHGRQLWKTDGVVGNESLVAVIAPDSSSSPWDPDLIAAENADAVYFTLWRTETGSELWRSDGTSAGTYLVVDLDPGSSGSNPNEITAIGDGVVFIANDSTYGLELRYATIAIPENQPPFVQIGGPYNVDEGKDIQLNALGTGDDRDAFADLTFAWDLDGDGQFDDANGPTPSLSFANVSGPATYNISLQVTDLDGASAVSKSTIKVFNVAPKLNADSLLVSVPTGNTALNTGTYSDNSADHVTLSASLGTIIDNNDGTWSWSWTWDANSAPQPKQSVTITAADDFTTTYLFFDVTTDDVNLVILKDISPGYENSGPRNLTRSGAYIYFFATQSGTPGLWRTDGTTANTTLVKEFPNTIGQFTDNLVDVDGDLYFFVRDNYNVTYLWKSDGTEAGTTLITALDGEGVVTPTNLTNGGGRLFFYMDDGIHGNELWISDGTAAGTRMVKDIDGSSGDGVAIGAASPVAVGNVVYFSIHDPTLGNQLWKSDGTEEGTVMAYDSGTYNFSPSQMVEFHDALYFFANDPVFGATLWMTDGTSGGTQRVSDVSIRSTFSQLVEFKDELYFTADGSPISGWELWKSDGTIGNAVQIADINPGAQSSNASRLTVAGNTLYFIADDGIHGEEIWKTDGSIGNASMVADLLPNNQIMTPWTANLIAAENEDAIYFVFYDAVAGFELWRSDGTSEGTNRVVDVYPGSANSKTTEITPINNMVVFAAEETVYGNEPRVATVGPPVNQAPNVRMGGPYFGDEGGSVQLDASGTTDDRDELGDLTFEWDFDGDGQYDDAQGPTPVLSLANYGGDSGFTVHARVTDLDGAQTIRTATVYVFNVAPQLTVDESALFLEQGNVATNGGTYADVPADTVTLSASIGAIVDNMDGTWSWSWDSTGHTAGFQIVTITAADGGTITQVFFDVTVNNVPPMIDAVKNSVTLEAGTMATNSGTFSDPDGDVDITASFGTVTQDDQTGTWSWSYDVPAGRNNSQTVKVTATDSNGAESFVTFDLIGDNLAPTIDLIEPLYSVNGGTVNINASATTDDFDAEGSLTFEWDLNGDSKYDDASGDFLTLPITGHNVGDVVTVHLRVTDTEGASSYATTTITIVEPATIDPPSGDVVVDEGSSITITGTMDRAIWITASAGAPQYVDTKNWKWTYDATDGPDESQTITLTVLGYGGVASTPVTFNLIVNNLAPDIAVDNSGVTFDGATTLTNAGTFSDPGDDDVTITASVGSIVQNDQDGTWSWSYDPPGGRVNSQTVTITATDSDGAASQVTFDLTGNNLPPTIDIGGPYYSVDGGTVFLNAGATIDDVDSLEDLSFAWDFNGDQQYDDAVGTNPGLLVSGYNVGDMVEVGLRVTDKEGATSYTTTMIEVVAAATVDVPSGGVVSVEEGSTVMVSGTMQRGIWISASIGTPEYIDTEHWGWSFAATDGPAESQTVEITVLGYGGVPTKITFELVVENAPPTVTVDNDSVTFAEGTEAKNIGSFSDLGGDPVTITASVGTIEQDDQTGEWIWRHDGLSGPADSQTVTITATDSDGGESQTTFELNVTNAPPSLTADVSSTTTTVSKTASVTGVYSDPGNDPLTFSASVGTVIDNLDGTWTWSLADAQLNDSQTITITADDQEGGTDVTTFDLTVLPKANAYLTINDGPATTDAGGEVDVLPDDLASITEWSEFTVNVWTMLDERYLDGLTDISVSITYNSDWFVLKGSQASSGVGHLTFSNNNGLLQIDANQIAAGDLGQGSYLLVGSFRFGPNPDGGVDNNSDTGYPEPVANLQFDITDVQMQIDGYGNVPGEQIGAPATLMQVMVYDTDDDGAIGLSDLTLLIRNVGESTGASSNLNAQTSGVEAEGLTATNSSAFRFDFDQDGYVSLTDLIYLIRNIGFTASSGDKVTLPPIASPITQSAQLESEASLFTFAATSTDPSTNAEPTVLSTTATSPLLETESVAPIIPLSSPTPNAANIDAAFGNLDPLSDCWEGSTSEEAEASLGQAVADAHDHWQALATDWALQQSATRSKIVEKAISLLDEVEDECPRIGRLIHWLDQWSDAD